MGSENKRDVLRPVMAVAEKLSRKTSGDVSGFVETFNISAIAGWAASASRRDVSLTVRVDGKDYPQAAVWSERKDVAERLGDYAARSGFQIKPDAELKRALSAASISTRSVAVLANGRPLPLRKGAIGGADSGVASGKRSEVRAVVESCSFFSIRGWAVSLEGGEGSIEVLVNGKAAECSVIRSERNDVSQALGHEFPEAGFEIELPGQLWELADGAESCDIRLRVDGYEVESAALRLSVNQVVQWIEEGAELWADEESRYHGLLALEHVRFARLFDRLGPKGKAFVLNIARTMKLEDYIRPQNSESTAPVALDDVPGEDASTLLLWAAMRELNSRLVHTSGSKFEVIREVLQKCKLRGVARDWYLNLAVQVTCGSGELTRLRELTSFEPLYALEHSGQAHQLSLLLPVLVIDRHIGRATDLMQRLTSQLGTSTWLHTECVRYAVDHVQQLEATGEIDLSAAEQFRCSFTALLDGFKGEWFSRLHDRELITAMVSLLARYEDYTDYHRRHLVEAAIRHYGLCPTFWELLDAGASRIASSELDRAARAWRRLSTALQSGRLGADQLEAVAEALAYFRRRGNPEAVLFLREAVCCSMVASNHELSPAARSLIESLLTTDQSEALRIAAYPLDGPNWVRREFPESNQELRQLLRTVADHSKSSMYDVQSAAASALQRAREAARVQDEVALQEALAEVERKAIALSNWQGMFLGADLLVDAYGLAADGGIAPEGFLMRLAEIIRVAVAESNADWYLPPPICSALARLCHRADQEQVLRGFLKEMQGIVRGKFGSSHDDLFSQAVVAPIANARAGWPQDTLVVIRSSRERLTTHVPALRATWIEDLAVRQIPYLVAVGDGDDSVDGDVLALRLPETAPETAVTLKLFDWVYRNTDAQFVFVVGDDCYLDVNRYFDTLSYRMHFYYGRIVFRGVGSLDRTGGELNGASDGRKRLDKSPEPSRYADGEAGYCLSRLAVARLLEAAASPSGKRLIANSFHSDKLVGDLLAGEHIVPANQDYDVCLLRKTHERARAVAMGANTFMPSTLTPTKLVRLGTPNEIQEVARRREDDEVWPKKIWPTYASPSLAHNSNQLELLTDVGHAERLLGADLVVVAVVRNEMIVLSHFLDHYRKLGVDCFVFVDNCSDDGTREYLLEQPDTVVYSADTEYRHSHYGVSWQQAVLGNHCIGKWVLLADADEFLVYENSESVPLREFVQTMDAEGADGALVYMIDMYPYGDLDEACFTKGKPFEVAPYFDKAPLIELRFGGGSYSNSRNFVNALRHRLAPSRINAYVSQKYALFKYQPWMRMTEGVHYAANMRVSAKPTFFAHFKYHSGFKNKVLTEIRRNQHFNGAEEYRRYASMLAEGGGDFGAEGVTRRYEGSQVFLAVAHDLEGTRDQ